MSSRLFPILVFVIALALGSLPRGAALDSGFWSDDYLQYAMLTGRYPLEREPFDLFRFAGGGRQETAALTGYGYYPWWTHQDFKLSMFRPFASLMHALDWALLGNEPYLHHLHTFVWWALSVAAVSALFFALLPRAAASVATILFAIDESHSVPMVWIANRSPLMATAFGAAGLLVHLRYRRSNSRIAQFGSLYLFTLALACGEYALPMLGYAVCLELLGPRAQAPRWRALWGLCAVAGTYVVASVLLGHGAAHSGFYTSPLGEPLAYAGKLLHGVPVLLGELLLGVPADHFTFGSPWPAKLVELGWLDPASLARLPDLHAVQIGLGVLAGGLGVLLLVQLRRRIAAEHAQHLIWLAAGSLLALLPVLGSFITTRLVLPASIGIAALIGSAIAVAGAALLQALRNATLQRAVGPLLLVLLLLHVHGYRALAEGRAATELYSQIARARSAIPEGAEVDNCAMRGLQLIVVAAADANDAPYLPFVRYANGHPLARGFRLLSGAPSAHELRRLSPNTIELTVLDRNALARSAVGSLTRSASDPLEVGQRVTLPGMTVEVLELHDTQPLRMRYTFDSPLEAPTLEWLEFGPLGLRPLTLPAVGASAVIAAPVLPEIAALLARGGT